MASCRTMLIIAPESACVIAFQKLSTWRHQKSCHRVTESSRKTISMGMLLLTRQARRRKECCRDWSSRSGTMAAFSWSPDFTPVRGTRLQNGLLQSDQQLYRAVPLIPSKKALLMWYAVASAILVRNLTSLYIALRKWVTMLTWQCTVAYCHVCFLH